MVCWLPIDMTTALSFLISSPVRYDTFLILMTIAFVNVLVNPIIYGTHIDVVMDRLRVMLCFSTRSE